MKQKVVYLVQHVLKMSDNTFKNLVQHVLKISDYTFSFMKRTSLMRCAAVMCFHHKPFATLHILAVTEFVQ